MAFFFAVTTLFGIALGIALSKTYKENSPTTLIAIGLLNASSAGLLIYMALVDLLSADFMGPKLQGSIKLQIKAYVAVLLSAGGMSLMAKWACVIGSSVNMSSCVNKKASEQILPMLKFQIL
ncbi:probable zinc transporter 10 [Actinidia eriantha]|uniref:probable zinc transporter 10 n=1 Tax=Actinidia eriantha TaxID=165200 RepID=UPI002590734C|nr:probable zinc transporter 10 [Actinidia eriantha]